MNRTAAELARRAADAMTRRDPDRPRFVAGSIGPTKKQLSMGVNVEDPGHRDVTFDEMVANYTEQVRGLVAAGVDILLPETSFDTLVLKACLFAIDEFFEETGTRLPVMISGTIFDERPDPVGADGRGVLVLGLALRRAERRPELRRGRRPDARADSRAWRRSPGRTSAATRTPACPTASAASTATWSTRPASLGEFARNGWLNIVGGCCGTTPEWIAAIAEAVEGVAPRQIPDIPALVDLQRHRAAGRPPRDQLPHGRRADQHHRLEAVRPADQGRGLRGGAGRRPRAGRGRGQHPRREHGRGADRRREGDDAVPQPGLRRARHRPGPDHDRQLELVGHRGGPEVRPGQVDRQLDQPEGGRGEVPRAGPARPALRRGGRRHGLRRGGPGGRRPTARSPSASGRIGC